MTERDASLVEIEAEAAQRHLTDHDDTTWETLAVPGTTNPPPDGEESGAWYRRSFEVPAEWSGRAVTHRSPRHAAVVVELPDADDPPSE